jgi:hypothetical protein
MMVQVLKETQNSKMQKLSWISPQDLEKLTKDAKPK